jgi:hypothetical protein
MCFRTNVPYYEATVTWKFTEFFEETKTLAVGVLALVQFEAILRLEQFQILAYSLWKDLQASPTTAAR